MKIDDVILLGNLNPKGYKVSIKQLALLEGYGVYEAELNVISGVWACFDVARTGCHTHDHRLEYFGPEFRKRAW